MLLDLIFGYAVSELVVILAFLLILFIIFKFGNLILGLVVNSILGLIAIYLVNVIFSLGITYDWVTWIVVALFGLPAVAVIIILKLLGISI